MDLFSHKLYINEIAILKVKAEFFYTGGETVCE